MILEHHPCVARLGFLADESGEHARVEYHSCFDHVQHLVHSALLISVSVATTKSLVSLAGAVGSGAVAAGKGTMNALSAAGSAIGGLFSSSRKTDNKNDKKDSTKDNKKDKKWCLPKLGNVVLWAGRCRIKNVGEPAKHCISYSHNHIFKA